MDETQKVLSDRFDRIMGQLDGLPDSVTTKPTTVQTLTPLLGEAQTFIVQTVRMKEEGDTVFLQYIGKEGSFRMVLPSKVTSVIARQRDALSSKVRSKVSRETMQARMDAGYKPSLPAGARGGKRKTKKGRA